MTIRIITTQADLEAFCSEIASAPHIAVDTEFMRERTYFAKLCLIQIASDFGNALVDPIAGNLDLAPLIALFNRNDMVKIMHSPEQDIEILFHLTGTIPQNIFDSQIAAQALGLGDSIAYHNLVQSILGVSLDKTQQYTDWLKRPLSDAQTVYALADVTHLLAMYPILVARLKAGNREEWIHDATGQLTDAKRYTPKPDEMYKKIKHQLKRSEQLATLQALAAWREHRAIAKDLPRQHVVRDEVLIEIAKHMPVDIEHFRNIRLPRPIKDERLINAMLEVVASVKNPESSSDFSGNKRTENLANSELVGLLTLLLKQRCRDVSVASRLIATRGDLEDVALGKTDIPCMQGWRAEIFGNAAKDLLAGKISFHWDSAEQQVVLG